MKKRTFCHPQNVFHAGMVTIILLYHLSLSLFLSPSLTFSLSLSPSLSLTHTHTHTHRYTYSPTISIFLISLTQFFWLTVPLSQSLLHILYHSFFYFTQTLFLTHLLRSCTKSPILTHCHSNTRSFYNSFFLTTALSHTDLLQHFLSLSHKCTLFPLLRPPK